MVTVGPFSFVVVPLYAGPLFEARAGAETESLAMLLNHAVELPADGIAEAIEQGREGGNMIVDVLVPESDDDDRALREEWAARTGERLDPGAVARVGTAVRDATLAVSWTVLRAALAELRALRAAWRPEPGPWLFTRPARSPFLTPEDHALVLRLEDEAAAIDALELDAWVGREPAAQIARRRAFLGACRDAGVFAADHAAAREQWLAILGKRLFALRRAANELRRLELLADSEQPLGGRVCLDYARRELWPPAKDAAHWARWGLSLLRPDAAGDQGEIVEQVGGSPMTVWWRRDGEVPALLAVFRGRRRRRVKGDRRREPRPR